MVGDDFDCPNCGYPYSEEYMEKMIWKNFKCEKCNYKIKVRLLKGYIRPLIRYDRMAYMKTAIREKENHKYMDSQIPLAIKSVVKNYNQDLINDFFSHGRKEWVVEARKNLIVASISVDIPKSHIISFFKSKGGGIDIRTINSYLNGK